MVGGLPKRAVRWYYLVALAVVVLTVAAFILLYVYKPTPPKAGTLTGITPSDAAHPSTLVKTDTADLNNSHTPQERAEIYASLGFDYLGTKQYDQSILAFQNSLKLGGYSTSFRLQVMNGLASAYSLNGQRSSAISEFQQIIVQIQQSSDPSLQAQIPSYQHSISQLQQGGSL